MKFTTNPTIVCGWTPDQISEIFNHVCEGYFIFPSPKVKGFGGTFITKVVNDHDGIIFLKELRRMMKYHGFGKVRCYGRNPNRKANGISRHNGWVRRDKATHLSLFRG